jgi:hypothetical protein
VPGGPSLKKNSFAGRGERVVLLSRHRNRLGAAALTSMRVPSAASKGSAEYGTAMMLRRSKKDNLALT